MPSGDVEAYATETARSQEQERPAPAYAVDADAVAEAILGRLVAGRTLAPACHWR